MTRRCFLLAAAAASASAQSPFRAGFAEAGISPSIGMEQPGGYGKVFHRKFHDECKVRAAVFDDGVKTVALVGVDALMLPRDLILATRREIHTRCGIHEGAVLIGASHSHSSGPTGFVQPGEYDHASSLVRTLAYEQSPAADPAYLELVRKQIVEAVCRAHAGRRPLRAGIGRGREDQVAFNRRFRMRNGQTWTHPRPGNPDIVGAAGPIDPEVGVIGAWDEAGKLIGCIVNYACHATTDPGGISANWIYYLEQTIRGVLGPEVVIVFLQGACGDITQVDNLSPYRNPAGEQWARLVGGRVGAEAVKVLLAATPGELVPLDYAARVWDIDRRIPDPARVREARQLVERPPSEAGKTEWIFAKEILLLDALIARRRQVEVEVQAVQVGPAVFISNPAEYFVEFGLEIKKRSLFPFTFPVELANGSVGYVPTEEALGPAGGGYETRLTSYSNLVAGAGRQMAEAGLRLAARMKPGQVPVPPPAPPFTAPWNYGNRPPELR